MEVNDLEVCASIRDSLGLEPDCLPFRCCRTESLIPSGKRFSMVVTLSAFALDSASHIDTIVMLHAAVVGMQIMPLDSVQCTAGCVPSSKQTQNIRVCDVIVTSAKLPV